MARIIFPNGAEVGVVPSNGKDFTINELQGIVDGFIEVVYLDNGELMVVNEEGKLHKKALNTKATDYMQANSRFDDFIVGNALVCDKTMIK